MKRKVLILIGVLVFGVCSFCTLRLSQANQLNESLEEKIVYMKDFTNGNLEEVEKFALENGLILNVTYEYSFEILKDQVVRQSIDEGSVIQDGDVWEVVISKGEVPSSVYREYQVNELGKVPIMMYHGIVNISSSETRYIGGNVDKDGYNRTAEAFRGDLEFYYRSGYRMIALDDYVEGKINVELGKSPIILTFDDGNENNFKVLGEENGELVIDPNCAVGILEEYKKKYPDFGVTATFFVNGGLFSQEEYNEKIVKWLVKHGYDVGNHSKTHPDFTKIGYEESKEEIGFVYQRLEQIIPDEYVSIVALPFGSPYRVTHQNYEAILNSSYLGVNYQTKAALRVRWEAENSCFDKAFQPTFLKRIRAYDNEGKEFDMEMNFKILDGTRYISDGNVGTIVIPESIVDQVKQTDIRVIGY